ncbi:MAG: YchJ family metal-binding protein [Myxococcota bacterium]
MSRRKNAYRAKPCVCGSKTLYRECCGRFHRAFEQGSEWDPNPEQLMRSRYSAYALGMVEYVIATTLPNSEAWRDDDTVWRDSLRAFAREFHFAGVEVLGVEPQEGTDSPEAAWVTFRAILRRGAKDRSFTERSQFSRKDGRWFYSGGRVSDEDESNP